MTEVQQRPMLLGDTCRGQQWEVGRGSKMVEMVQDGWVSMRTLTLAL